MKNQFKFIKISSAVDRTTKQAIRSAINYEKVTGRKLGITGEIGEILVCKELGLKLLADSIASGIDAIDNKGKTYQIKARRGNSDNSGARIGAFSKYKFDYAVLAILDHKYNIIELYKVTFKKIKPILQLYKKRNPPLRQFKNVATLIKLREKIDR